MKARIVALFGALIVALGTATVSAPAANAADPFMCSYNYDAYTYGGGANGSSASFNRASFCLKPRNDAFGSKLIFQGDGNLVHYRNGVARWASGTNGRGATFVLQADGNAVIYNASGQAIWATGTTGSTSTNKRRMTQYAGSVSTSIFSVVNGVNQTRLWYN